MHDIVTTLENSPRAVADAEKAMELALFREKQAAALAYQKLRETHSQGDAEELSILDPAYEEKHLAYIEAKANYTHQQNLMVNSRKLSDLHRSTL